jgi:orotidine-5'-phosphate decarboxylase
MDNFADRLLKAIEEKQNPSVIGLDPRIENVPSKIKDAAIKKYGNTKKAVAQAFLEFNKKIIDATCDIVPAYKPQMAFYEKYGVEGVQAFQETVAYIKSKGCIVIEDAKRNDIGSTAKAYSEGHLGVISLCDGSLVPSFDVDAITVNAYLGIDGVKPFIQDIEDRGKGIFVLVKTSNPSSGELQDKKLDSGKTIYENMAEVVSEWGKSSIGEKGYNSVGAVVGATYPGQAKILRKLMPNTIFLVPGYGAQGGGAKDVAPCFNKDGYGAIVNSSRGIIFAYQKDPWKQQYGEENFDKAARAAALHMKEDIANALKEE